MRLWHKDLIPYLPRLQLIAQWRECCCICKNLADKGTPNHILVNKVLEYPTVDFLCYTNTVLTEMKRRNYKVSEKSRLNFASNYEKINFQNKNNYKPMFDKWHNERYLIQCLFNLQEKHDCGGIPEDEWNLIENRFFNLKLNDKSDKVEYALRNDKKRTVYVKIKE